MSKKSKVALPAGELFLLHDEREEADLLDQMRDPDPVFSAALAAENDRRMKALDPTFPYGLYENRAFECPAELIHPSTLVRGKQPKSLPHTDRMFNFANVDGTSSIHIVVSTEWKEAIEELELGTHQFYPHRLDFADGSSAQRFIMRDRAPVLHGLFVPKLTRITRGDIRSIRRGHEFDEQILAVFKAARVDPGALPHPRLSYSHAIPPIEASSELSEGDLAWHTPNQELKALLIPIDGMQLGKRHYVNYEVRGRMAVSRDLAVRLQPLLSVKMTAVPLPVAPGSYAICRRRRFSVR